jgi:hypothetical protein
MQYEKPKNDHAAVNTDKSRRVGAVVLIIIGVLFLLMNAGVFSFNDIGQFFGNLGGGIGEFFGTLGGEIGRFFGSLGGAIGEFFGGVGRTIGELWPLLLIVVGLALLFWRRPARSATSEE